MNSKEVAEKLGYKTAKEMFNNIGYKQTAFHKLKPSSQAAKLNEIILNHFSIDTNELLKIIELYKLQQDKIQT